MNHNLISVGSSPTDQPLTGPCPDCSRGTPPGFDFTMAFQPIVDLDARRAFAQEALVRGLGGEGAGSILGQVDDGNRYRFVQLCRIKAVRLAAKLGIDTRLAINFLPNAVYDPEGCIRTTIASAQSAGMPLENIIFEITEVEQVRDHEHLRSIFETYRPGATGSAPPSTISAPATPGLGLLAEIQPDNLKLDSRHRRRTGETGHRPRHRRHRPGK